jgi:hypothetical protein
MEVDVKYNLTLAAYHLRDALKSLDTAKDCISNAFDGYDPGYPAPDSQDARAWDYLDAIREAQRALGHRLNTWDKGDYDE